jgi:arylsulfatase
VIRSALLPASLLLGLLAGPLAGALAPQAAPRGSTLLVRFRAEAVDGSEELVIHGRQASVRHLDWKPMEGVEIEVVAPPPESEQLQVVVRGKSGRPALKVVQQPSRLNDGELRVSIDDGPHAGASPLSFELWAVPRTAAPLAIDVVVITIDSLRPDHLGCYGYALPTSPNLDAFAAGAVRFTNAFSTSSFTPPAHASLLTSRQVGDHGLLGWDKLPEEQVTLAEVLSAQGWRTGASVNLNMLSKNALGQGLDWGREGDREARVIVSDALEFLRGSVDQPCFLWLHLYDVHRPYGRVRGWTDRFASVARPGIGDGESHYNVKPADVRAIGLSPEDLAWIVDRYDAGIAYADAQLGPLLDELSTPDRRARTLVVITADHGESLLEHEEFIFSHDPYLYSAVGRVPLLVRYPDGLGAGAVHGDMVSLIDVAPTVLATLELAAPPTFSGRSLRELEHGADWSGREVYQECWGWERLAGARDPRWFVLSDLRRGSTRLFDLSADPDEQHPLDPASRPEAAALVGRLAAFAARRPADESLPALDPELVQRLQELGYVGGDR